MDTASWFSLTGKHALVTGGSRGIGEMIARAYVAAGAQVLIASRDGSACEALADELGDSCRAVVADLSTPQGVEELAAATATWTDHLDVLVNNAGATWGARLGEYPAEGFDKVMDLNVRAVFLLTQALLPQLRAAASVADPARVLMIGSVDGLSVPVFDSFAYSASKAAVHQLSTHLAAALAPEHVTVNALAPGLFPSKMTAFLFADEEAVTARIPLGRPGRLEDIGGMAIALASRAGSYVTGTVLPIDGGYATLR